MFISAAAFKAECLKLMDRVAKTGEAVVITKHGRPVAQLTPVAPEPKSMFGYMKGLVGTTGDIVSPVDEAWSALTGDEDEIYNRLSTKKGARHK
jgi:prevent-host-death family protein